MTKDFAKPSTTRPSPDNKGKKGKQKRPQSKKREIPNHTKAAKINNTSTNPNKKKLLAVLLLVIVVFSYGVYFLRSVPPTQTPVLQKPATKTEPIAQKPKAEEKPAPQRFKFYDLLEESEVIAPKVDAYTFTEKDHGDSYYYLIQTGSFKNIADAERQKATIAFQGLKATINSVQSESGTTWHRVSTGPFTDRSTMNSALDKLVAINIEPLVKKIKKTP